MSRSFALVPAAGNSSRMGQPKLLLPMAGRPLIRHAVAAWQQSKVDHVFVVVRPNDEALANVVRATGADVVIPQFSPPDMKASLQAALRHVEHHLAPSADDTFLVAPADMPRLSSAVINSLLERNTSAPHRILVPTLAGRRGHPVLFPWTLANEVHDLPANEGLDAIVRRHEPLFIPCDRLLATNQDAFLDIDTPEEYQVEKAKE